MAAFMHGIVEEVAQSSKSGTGRHTRAIMSNSTDGEPPYGFESSWADISDDSEQGAWEDYNAAKRK
eukprot:2629780-Pleurochrysis_carterae.AAC.1